MGNLGGCKNRVWEIWGYPEKDQKKLTEATDVVDKAGVRSRMIERKLKDVQELPATKAARMLEDSLKIIPKLPYWNVSFRKPHSDSPLLIGKEI